MLSLIDREVARGGGAASISRLTFERSGISHRAAGFGVKQVELCGFFTVEVGPRRINMFTLADGWRSLDADEGVRRVQLAKLPKPPRTSR